MFNVRRSSRAVKTTYRDSDEESENGQDNDYNDDSSDFEMEIKPKRTRNTSKNGKNSKKSQFSDVRRTTRKPKPVKRNYSESDESEVEIETTRSRNDSEKSKTEKTKGLYYESEVSDEEQYYEEMGSEEEREFQRKQAEEANLSKIEKVLDERYEIPSLFGSCTTMYAENKQTDKSVLEKPKTEGLSENEKPQNPKPHNPSDKKVRQFLIKWENWSHIHNTWETIDSMKSSRAKGFAKVENFAKRQDELNEYLLSIQDDEKEYYHCQLEASRQLIQKYKAVDRIILQRADIEDTGGTENEYFIKWKGLPYAESSWESEKLIVEHFAADVEYFNIRMKNQYTCVAKHRINRPHSFKGKVPNDGLAPWITEDYRTRDLGLPKLETPLCLRDYQCDGVNWLCKTWVKNRSCILADEMGLGKTIQVINMLSWFSVVQNTHGPHLVIVPLSTLPYWEAEFMKWAPWLNVVVYIGDTKSRQIIQQYEWFEDWEYQGYNTSKNKKSPTLNFNVIITTYEMIIRDSDFLSNTPWMTMSVDEAHRLKNVNSSLYQLLMTYSALKNFGLDPKFGHF